MLSEAVAALVGAIVGGLITGALALWRDRVAWNRRKTTRWDDVRRQAYGAFLQAVHAVVDEGHVTPYSFRGHLAEGESEEAYRALAELHNTEAAMWLAYREIEILGGEAVVKAARTAIAAARDISSAEDAVLTRSSEKTLARSEQAHAGVTRSLDQFREAVRREIGINDAAH